MSWFYLCSPIAIPPPQINKATVVNNGWDARSGWKVFLGRNSVFTTMVRVVR